MTTATTRKLLLRACPRCHGDLFLTPDEDAFACLQCGREIALAQLEASATIDELLAGRMNVRRRLQAVPESRKERHDDAA